MNFYVETCHVLNKDRKVAVVQDTCSATIFNTERLQSARLVQKSSKFRFNTFAFDQTSQSQGNEITCEISVCLKGSHCEESAQKLPKSDADCLGIEQLKFKLQ